MTHPDEGSETAAELMPMRPPTQTYTLAPEPSRTAGSTAGTRFDPVQRPAHYAHGSIQCADAIEVALEGETDALVAWCRGNAIKYLWRTGKKGNAAEDLRKAIWYIERAAKHLEARDGNR